jgi:cytochrome c-type biogenesis protein CcmH
MMLWILAGLLSAGVVALLAIPFLRGRSTGAADHPDLAVYRDQLAELEREVGRGLLPETEAASARLEIQRRLLVAAGKERPAAETEPQRVRPRNRAVLAALLLLLLPAAAVAIYLDLGSPDLPALPFAARASTAGQDQQMAALVDQLKARMTAHPEDPRGWLLLAESEGQLGRYAESADDYGRAISRLEAGHQPVPAAISSLRGEALTAAADGQVTPAAKAAFNTALTSDPKDARARFYMALADSQAGHLDTALAQWVALEAESPADAPWRAMLAAQIDATAKKLGRDPTTLPGRKPPPPAPAAGAPSSGPTAEDMAKAAAMTPEQRAAFIGSMVSGLAARLKDHPEDIDGWLRLADAYDKLGRPDDALAAWHEASSRAPDRLDAQIAYVAAGAVRAERGATPADFEAAVVRLTKLAPENPLGIYSTGLIAETRGDKAGAKAAWQKLLPLMPEGSSQRQQLEARIAKLGS